MPIQYMKDNKTSISLEESGTIHSPTPTASPSPTKAPTSTKLPTPPLITSNDTIESFLTKDDLYLLNANTVLTISELGNNYVDNTFYSMNLDKPLINRIYGKSYKENSTITYDDLHYVRVLHYDFTGQIRIGELIVNKDISEDLVDIFYELYEAKYPIEKMVLVDDYNGDDNTSMANNNTSAFNYREINGSNNLSKAT